MLERLNNSREVMTAEQFAEMFESKLGDQYKEALELFLHYSEGPQGPYLSSRFAEFLTQAVAREKVTEVLGQLKDGWERILKEEPVGTRGKSASILTAPYTHIQIVFKRILGILRSKT